MPHKAAVSYFVITLRYSYVIKESLKAAINENAVKEWRLSSEKASHLPYKKHVFLRLLSVYVDRYRSQPKSCGIISGTGSLSNLWESQGYRDSCRNSAASKDIAELRKQPARWRWNHIGWGGANQRLIVRLEYIVLMHRGPICSLLRHDVEIATETDHNQNRCGL